MRQFTRKQSCNSTQCSYYLPKQSYVPTYLLFPVTSKYRFLLSIVMHCFNCPRKAKSVKVMINAA